MKILIIHNTYKSRGGEDEVRDAETCLLEAHGHQVDQVTFDNGDIQPRGHLRVGIEATWARGAYTLVEKKIRAFQPDIVNIHNFFPKASPAVHYAARSLRVPVVQVLHNYRLLCPAGTFYRDGHVCEDCTRHSIPWPSVVHGCYRQSRLQTGAVALMLAVHRTLRTWQRGVAVFVAVSEFEKRRFVANGFPEARVAVKPNFVPNPGRPGIGGDNLLFVGRLSPEKGIGTLLKAMESVRSNVRLRIVGNGPMAAEVVAAAARDPRVEYLGPLPQVAVRELMGASRCLIFPSEWYETFGLVVAEAFAKGTPVIASALGAPAELVDHGRTGFLFRPGDPTALARTIDMASNDSGSADDMRREARREYERLYTAERNYEILMAIYGQAMEFNRMRLTRVKDCSVLASRARAEPSS